MDLLAVLRQGCRIVRPVIAAMLDAVDVDHIRTFTVLLASARWQGVSVLVILMKMW